jgi:hypothetical protein
MDRRDLLKKFGIGVVIAPIIGGIVERDASAQLIEVPKVKPVELFTKIPEDLNLNDVESAEIVMKLNSGKSRSIAINKWWSSGVIAAKDQFRVDVSFISTNASPQFKFGSIYGPSHLA